MTDPAAEQSAMDQQLIGRTLLGCRIESVIGRGAAGTVFMARHLQIDCLRAIKVLKPHLASNRQMLERFRSEARSAASIHHENLVTLHNADEEAGYFAYVMEYVEGQTLARRVADGGPLDPHEAVELLCQVCAGLAAAHQAGITHRDIKPENLLLTADGRIKVTDFGLARAEDSQRLTQDGQALGTPPYMSPEQCEGQEIDGRSDLYSLGLVGYYLLTGTEPMLGDNPMATMYNQVHREPDPPQLLRPSIGPALSDVICRMLAKQPAQRQPDAEAVIQALRAALHSAPGSAAPVLLRTHVDQPVDSPSSHFALAGVVRQLSLLIAGLLVGWLLQGLFGELPSTNRPYSKRQAPDVPDLIPQYIRALERDDQSVAFDVLARHLARHPRDWKRRSERIELGRQLDQILDALADLQALDSAGKLSDLEIETLMDLYLKHEQNKQAGELMQRVSRHSPKLALQLAQEQARQLLDAGRPCAAARAWLQTPSGTHPGSLFLRTLDRDLRERFSNPGRRRPADLRRLMLDLAKRDPRFFHWPSLVVWLAADPRRVEPLGLKLLERVLDESCREHKWDVIGRAAGKALMTSHSARAAQLAKEGRQEASRAFEADLYGKTVHHLTRVLALVPLDVTALSNRSRASWSLGKKTRALADCAKALRLEPGQPEVLHWHGWMLRDSGQYAKAIRDFTAAITELKRQKHILLPIARDFLSRFKSTSKSSKRL